jgi:hypothetical protein
MYQLTSDDARLLFGFLASVAVPFLVSWLKRPIASRGVRFLVAVAVSAVGAVLSEVAAGTLGGMSTVAMIIGVFTVAQAHYASWFSGLGLEDAISAPREE